MKNSCKIHSPTTAGLPHFYLCYSVLKNCWTQTCLKKKSGCCAQQPHCVVLGVDVHSETSKSCNQKPCLAFGISLGFSLMLEVIGICLFFELQMVLFHPTCCLCSLLGLACRNTRSELHK